MAEITNNSQEVVITTVNGFKDRRKEIFELVKNGTLVIIRSEFGDLKLVPVKYS